MGQKKVFVGQDYYTGNWVKEKSLGGIGSGFLQ